MKQLYVKEEQSKRLVGIDLFRGVSAFAVVVIHASAVMLYSDIPTDQWTESLVQLSRFAVPFFLAASFYFMSNSLYVPKSSTSLRKNFNSKFMRLMVPYLCWTAIYSFSRAVKLSEVPNGLGKLFQDFIGLIFFGGASIHLYFVPLLFSGSFLILPAGYLAKKKINVFTLLCFFIASILMYESLIVSGNSFEFGDNCLEKTNSCLVAFQSFQKMVFSDPNENQFLRFILVQFSWLIQCLPYVFLAMIFNHPSMRENIFKIGVQYVSAAFVLFLAFSSFSVLNLFSIMYFPKALYELGVATCLLFLAITLSGYIKESRILINLGTCSFGIYFVHYLVLIICEMVYSKLALGTLGISPVIILFLFSIVGFGFSWGIASLLTTSKITSKLLLGA